MHSAAASTALLTTAPLMALEAKGQKILLEGFPVTGGNEKGAQVAPRAR
jgi:hypothetical protein